MAVISCNQVANHAVTASVVTNPRFGIIKIDSGRALFCRPSQRRTPGIYNLLSWQRACFDNVLWIRRNASWCRQLPKMWKFSDNKDILPCVFPFLPQTVSGRNSSIAIKLIAKTVKARGNRRMTRLAQNLERAIVPVADSSLYRWPVIKKPETTKKTSTPTKPPLIRFGHK